MTATERKPWGPFAGVTATEHLATRHAMQEEIKTLRGLLNGTHTFSHWQVLATPTERHPALTEPPDGDPVSDRGGHTLPHWQESGRVQAETIREQDALLDRAIVVLDYCIGHIEWSNQRHPEDHPINDCPVLNAARKFFDEIKAVRGSR